MDWKKTLATQSLKLMSDPRVAKLMQDERFLKLMMAAMSAPAKVQSFTAEHKDSVFDSLGLATREEVDDLRRTVRSLEEQLGALQEVLGTLVGDLPPGTLGGQGRDDDELDEDERGLVAPPPGESRGRVGVSRPGARLTRSRGRRRP